MADVTPASTQAELWLEVERLRGVISRNKTSFETLKQESTALRDRAISAESALEELRRIVAGNKSRDPSDADVAYDLIKRVISGVYPKT
jgi:cytochrome c-type biogenesis protein CcmH/NrfF